MRIGGGLDGRRLGHNAESLNRAKRAEGWADTNTQAAVSREDLFTTQGGTVYPVFILGVHDPDDPNVTRWAL